jgi:hypothetical protein
LGNVVRLRTFEYAERRWQATFKQVNPSASEKAALAKAIGELRHRDLPLPGDWEVSMLPIAVWVNYQHRIAGTSLRLTYNFDETGETLELFSLHRDLV